MQLRTVLQGAGSEPPRLTQGFSLSYSPLAAPLSCVSPVPLTPRSPAHSALCAQLHLPRSLGRQAQPGTKDSGKWAKVPSFALMGLLNDFSWFRRIPQARLWRHTNLRLG